MGPAEKDTAVRSGPAADHRRLARRPVLNDLIQLIGPASLVGNSRQTFHKSGTDGFESGSLSEQSSCTAADGNGMWLRPVRSTNFSRRDGTSDPRRATAGFLGVATLGVGG